MSSNRTRLGTKEDRTVGLVEQMQDRHLNYHETKERWLQFFHTISKEYGHEDLAPLETYMKQVQCRGAFPIMTADGKYTTTPPHPVERTLAERRKAKS